MSQRLRQGFYWAGAALMVLAGGVAFLVRKRQRKTTALPAALPAQPDDTQPIAALAAPQMMENVSAPARSRLWMLLPLLRFGAAFAGLTTAQALLLESRNPVMPFLLFGLALVMLLPALERFPLTLTEASVPPWHVAAVLGFMLAAFWTQSGLPALPAVPPDISADAQGILYDLLRGIPVGLLLVWAVPAVYALGALVASPLAGLFSAGLMAVNLYALALGQVGAVYAALPLGGALFLAAFGFALRRPSRGRYALVVVVFAAAWLISPLAFYLLLLPPVYLIFQALDEQRPGRWLHVFLALGVVMAVLALAVWQVPADFKTRAGYSPLIAIADGLFNTLLLFNLSADPSPLHGIIHRPAFGPPLAALFLMGAAGWASRVVQARRWREGWLFAALVIGALPSAFLVTLPLSAPHLGRAGLMLPVAAVLAGWALRLLAVQAVAVAGRRGLLLVGLLSLWVLLATAQDSRRHYCDTFLPSYEYAAPTALELDTSQ